MARCVASLLLLLALVAAVCTHAFAPGAAVNRRGGKLATAFSRVWGAKQQRQLALSRLMATRGGVAGGKVRVCGLVGLMGLCVSGWFEG